MFNKIFFIVALLLSTEVTLNAVTYEPLPNHPYWNGFHYYFDMTDYPNLLSSSMPYQVLQGYIVADSVVKAMPGRKYQMSSIEKMNPFLDTAQYIYKYWCYMNDYNPLWFYSFEGKKYSGARTSPYGLLTDLRNRMYIDPKFKYVISSYILHIYVNNTFWIDTPDVRKPDDFWSKTIAYCKVLDTLKGKQFPSLNDAIFYNGELPDSGSSIVANIPPQTDIVFSYKDSWQSWNSELYPLDWIKPGNEYIVFLEINGRDNLKNLDGSINKHYYSIAPFSKYGFRGIYQIENGMVKDADNVLGFGKKNSVNIFKQNIINKLEEIKNYGE